MSKKCSKVFKSRKRARGRICRTRGYLFFSYLDTRVREKDARMGVRESERIKELFYSRGNFLPLLSFSIIRLSLSELNRAGFFAYPVFCVIPPSSLGVVATTTSVLATTNSVVAGTYSVPASTSSSTSVVVATAPSSSDRRRQQSPSSSPDSAPPPRSRLRSYSPHSPQESPRSRSTTPPPRRGCW